MKAVVLRSIAAGAAALLAASAGHAQLAFTTTGTQTITFDSDISNTVVTGSLSANEAYRYVGVTEPTSWNWTGGYMYAISSRAFTARETYWNPGAPLVMNSRT